MNKFTFPWNFLFFADICMENICAKNGKQFFISTSDSMRLQKSSEVTWW